jgi:predicted PurR-regulated permease PerM
VLHLLASSVTTDGTSQASTIFAILASAVIVCGGLAALVRAIWKTANLLRDNTRATQTLTERLEEFTKSVDGRFEKLDARVTVLESSARKARGRATTESA